MRAPRGKRPPASMQQAQRAYEIAELRYREGLSTQLELSDARLLLQQAQANRAQAARDVQVARVRLALLPDLPLTNTGANTPTGLAGGQNAARRRRQRRRRTDADRDRQARQGDDTGQPARLERRDDAAATMNAIMTFGQSRHAEIDEGARSCADTRRQPRRGRVQQAGRGRSEGRQRAGAGRRSRPREHHSRHRAGDRHRSADLRHVDRRERSDRESRSRRRRCCRSPRKSATP